MLLKRIETWYSKLKSNLFNYKDGFFELSYLANSPQSIIESAIKMPFIRHDKKTQTLKAIVNPFIDVTVHYQEIEEGLCFFFTDIEFKKNIHLKLIIDKYFSANYYLLIFQISKLPYLSGKPFLDGGLTYDCKSWALLKPGKTISVNYFKNTHGLFYSIYFSEEWLEKNILPIEWLQNSELSAFLASNRDYIIWPELEINSVPIFDTIKDCIQQKGGKGVANLLELKIHTLNLINSFLTHLLDKEKYKHYFNVEDSDRKRALQAERIIMEHLFADFPSIEEIAKKLNISPTKLKSDFKVQFGMPMYQYYLSKKMMYAKELLLKDNILIKEVAHRMGYENISKFSATFKKHQGCLPSDLSQQKKLINGAASGLSNLVV